MGGGKMASRLVGILVPGIDDPGIDPKARKQAPFVAVFTLILLTVFLLLVPVSLASDGWKPSLYTASLVALAAVCGLAMAMLRKTRLREASRLMTAALLLSCAAALFLMRYRGAASQAYRPLAFMAVMTACNVLISMDRRQIIAFFLGTLVCWLAGFATIFRGFFAPETSSESLAIMVVGVMGLALVSAVSLFIRRLSDDLLASAEEEARRSRAALEGLTASLREARQGMEIGDRVIGAARLVEAAAGSIASVQGALAEGSAGLVRESEEFSRSSRLVEEGARALRSATESQNASIAETSSSIAQISVNLSSINGIATQRRKGLGEVVSSGDAQRELLKRLLASVSAVQESSKEIGSFVSTVQDIASRTSLLSMNASIEAARAGSAGKGFSVVAQEIRGLSEETQRNADTIKALLDRNSQTVRAASEMTGAFSSFIERNEATLREVMGSIDEVLRGVTEMDVGTREVVEALADMVGSSQESAGRVGEVLSQVEGQKRLFERIEGFAADLHERVGQMERASAEIAEAASRVAEAGRLNTEQVRRIQLHIEGGV
jgi:methyl-accepting chemotaxis protein